MPFEIPENIHPDCARLAWILGSWQCNGHGAYPTIDKFQFGQEVIFQQDGRPFIHYLSRSWIVDEQGETVREAAQETGFLRPQPDGRLEVVLGQVPCVRSSGPGARRSGQQQHTHCVVDEAQALEINPRRMLDETRPRRRRHLELAVGIDDPAVTPVGLVALATQHRSRTV